MTRLRKRTGAALLALLIGAAVSVSAVKLEAAALQYNGTASYMSGTYYQALREVCLTGDSRTDMVNIAYSQLGYQEGGSPNQLSGQVYGGVNHTEYGAWYGVQDMWCAMFVSWCAQVAGVSEKIVPRHAFTPDGLQWFANRGRAYSREEAASGIYDPQPGDLVYFKSSRNTRTTNHVGLVTGYAEGRLYTIEGNVASAGTPSNGGAVVAKSYPISNGYIVYICSPNYEVGGTNVLLSDGDRSEASGAETLRYALSAAESGGELGYDAISQVQGLSLGIGQWSGTEALDLLNRIRQADEKNFNLLDTAGIGEMLECWQASSRLDEKTLECLKTILSSHVGVQVQEEKLEEQMGRSIALADSLGVEDTQAQLLCAAIAHLGGNGMVRRCVQLAKGDLSRNGLLAVLQQVSPTVYHSCQAVKL